MNGNIREWINEFLNNPGRPEGSPDGRPLYSYQTKVTEYEELKDHIKAAYLERRSSTGSSYWSAGFCLFVSEFYRRDYDGGTGGWTWSAPESSLGIELNFDLRREVTIRGLVKFWKRPIRTGDSGRQFLGTLYAEGGLPWKLVQNNKHGFGRAIRGGLRHHDQVVSLGQSPEKSIERHAHYLPKSFQNTEIYEMLAAIVFELMRIASTYPTLPPTPDEAVEFLDRESPGWRRRFPIPLGEANGRELVAAWFTDAVRERKYAGNDESGERLTSKTVLNCSEDWSVTTTVTLPESVHFDLDGATIGSTRLTLALFEGHERLESLSSVYAELQKDGASIKLRFRQRSCEVTRRSICEPLTLRVFSQGSLIGVLMIDSPTESGGDLPLIFAPIDECEWLWVGSASTSLSHDIARVFVPCSPEMFGSVSSHTVLELGETLTPWMEGQSGVWVDFHESTTIETLSGTVHLTLREEGLHKKPTLEGILTSKDTLPGQSYVGFPKIQPPSDSNLTMTDFVVSLNGRCPTKAYIGDFVGTANLTISHPDHGLLLRRRFGVLPKDMRIQLHPGISTTPARLTIQTDANIDIGVHGEGFSTRRKPDVISHQFELRPNSMELNSLVISISLLGQEAVEPVVVRLPFPQFPALLIDSDNVEIRSNQLSLNSLLGTRLVLSADGSNRRFSHVSFTLEGRRGRKLELHQKISVGGTPVTMPLHASREDWIRMLSASSDQDDFVRVVVESDRLLIRFTVRRFDAKLKREEIDGVVALYSFDEKPSTASIQLLAMDVASPEKMPVSVAERTSGSVATGLYELPEETNSGGPWLIYSHASSSTSVRPFFVGSNVCDNESAVALTPLHQACARFDHNSNPTAIDDVISSMAEDFWHLGWDYLRSLRKNYSCLPLSSFEAWRSVAKSPQALVSTLMRLEPDSNFVDRIASELAVVWEEIPLQLWDDGLQKLKAEHDKKFGDSGLSSSIVKSRLKMLAESIPWFEYFAQYDSGRVYPQGTNLFIQEHVLGKWHQELLHRHSQNDHWPDLLRKPLQQWYWSQSVVPKPASFPKDIPVFKQAVSYLPLFMAAVTAGKAFLEELDSDPEAVRFDLRVLADFDRSWYEPVYAQTVAILSEKNN